MINVSLGIVAKKGVEISRTVSSYHTPITIMLVVTMLYTILTEIYVNVLYCYWPVKEKYTVSCTVVK
jgi:hypothetical protein